MFSIRSFFAAEDAIDSAGLRRESSLACVAYATRGSGKFRVRIEGTYDTSRDTLSYPICARNGGYPFRATTAATTAVVGL